MKNNNIKYDNFSKGISDKDFIIISTIEAKEEAKKVFEKIALTPKKPSALIRKQVAQF